MIKKDKIPLNKIVVLAPGLFEGSKNYPKNPLLDLDEYKDKIIQISTEYYLNHKYNEQKISDDFMKSVITFIFSFLLIFLIIALMLSLSGLDFLTAISGAASAISNVGPGLGEMIGPDGNYKNIPDISKWILSFGMLLGRLELFAILVLFFPSFWRN